MNGTENKPITDITRVNKILKGVFPHIDVSIRSYLCEILKEALQNKKISNHQQLNSILSHFSNYELYSTEDELNSLTLSIFNKLIKNNDTITPKTYKSNNLKSIRIGMKVKAKYYEDQQWYNAQIIKIDVKKQTNKILVKYTEYGNTEWIDPLDIKMSARNNTVSNQRLPQQSNNKKEENKSNQHDSDLLKQLNLLSQQNDMLRNENNKLSQQYTKIWHENEKICGKRNKLSECNHNLQQQLKTKDDKIQSLQVEIDKLKIANDNLNANLKALLKQESHLNTPIIFQPHILETRNDQSKRTINVKKYSHPSCHNIESVGILSKQHESNKSNIEFLNDNKANNNNSISDVSDHDMESHILVNVNSNSSVQYVTYLHDTIKGQFDRMNILQDTINSKDKQIHQLLIQLQTAEYNVGKLQSSEKIKISKYNVEFVHDNNVNNNGY